MLGNKLKIVKGSSHTDERGRITFVNDFDMENVRRFYRIKHYDTSIIRGWRGHKIEQRWFHVCEGEFEVKLVEIDNWINPNRFLTVKTFVLKANDECVLHIPAGFASCIKATMAGSEMLVFADHLISNAKNDDYLFPLDYFVEKNK